MRKRSRILLGIGVVWLVASLIPLNRENPPVVADLDAPPEVEEVLRRACYDCHSNETEWPWYSYVAPMNFLVTQDVDAGRHQLNFSEWGTIEPDVQEAIREEIWEEVEDGEMPPAQYRIPRSRGKLSAEDLKILEKWGQPY